MTLWLVAALWIGGSFGVIALWCVVVFRAERKRQRIARAFQEECRAASLEAQARTNPNLVLLQKGRVQ